MSWADATLARASKALGRDEVQPSVLLETCLERIQSQKDLHAFLHVAADEARSAAEASDRRQREGKRLGPLDGIPVALKDVLVTQDMPTTAASKILEGWRSPYDGAMARRLRDAGAVLVGKTNLDEFAMGSSNEQSARGPTRNPWDPLRVPGGSSGGSAVAVASGQALGSLGTDTGGSIRQPASFCGVYGLKPTYGRVSRAGVVAFASSLDQVGPFGRSAEDLALLMNAISGFDPEDSTSIDRPSPDHLEHLDTDVEGLRVGLPEEYFGEGVMAEVSSCVRDGVAALERAGAVVTPVSLPHTRLALSTYYVLCTAEASSNLARYDGVRYGFRAEASELREMYARSRFEGFGTEVRRRIILGTYVLSAGYREAYYDRAQRVRTLIRRDFEEVFEKVDCLASPVAPTPAFRIGDKVDDPLTMYAADVLTLAVNLAGIPGLSIPVGFSSEGLPIGLQLMGRWFEEPQLLRVAAALERASDAHQRRPPT
ncbi:MAG: Asp-tRNA(Asn)/Glu-tRNA(Gln) amidotransferase subunit GatA [Myxococcota bacterium]